MKEQEKGQAGVDLGSASAQPLDGSRQSIYEDSKTADVEQGTPEKPQGPPPGAFDPRQNPDGGLKAWLCVLGGFCSLFCSFGWINCVGVFQTYYQMHQLSEYAPDTIAWVASLEIFFMFCCGPVIGKLFDNYGPKWLLVAGTVLEVFGLMMTSLSTEYYQFILAQGVCSSIGASLVFYPAMSTIPTWFFQKRGFAFGIIAGGSSLGGVILPIMVWIPAMFVLTHKADPHQVQRLIPEVGFAWAMRTTAFLIFFMLIVANLTITSRLPPKPTPFDLFEFLRPLREPAFQLLAFGCFIFFLGMFLPINYIILEAIHNGMSADLAQYMVPILNAASFFGRTLPGFIADKVGRYNTMFVMCSFTGIITLALWLPAKANAPIIVFAALFGFGSGAFVSLAPSLVAQISDVRKIGVRTGTLFAVISIAALISQPIGGALVTRWDGAYTGLQIYAGVLMCGGAVVLLLARIKLAGLKVSTKF
ncbi:uncharacterized protein LTR77_006176 [Saxophila tyrrhenica]|uniref:Major facilitator superfamily (MFS) profile domain-containing protein n=1 Tax=Saxophila tyrrhenica TaxID=1690608 RepID=A0AAV9P7S0_9PEZI|nr:hypothetical protein LTR77_006176 [Saxophila tyrrhenica]